MKRVLSSWLRQRGGRASARTVVVVDPGNLVQTDPDRRADAPRIRHPLGAISDDPAHDAEALGTWTDTARHPSPSRVMIRRAGRMAPPGSKDSTAATTAEPLYRRVTRPLDQPGGLLDRLPAPARRAVENAYATIEITDASRTIAGHQVSLMRGYTGPLQQAVQALESDVLATRSSYHELTAILDKVAAGELLARRQDIATNQLLSHALEQLLARNKRLRDSEAALMNMRLGGLQ